MINRGKDKPNECANVPPVPSVHCFSKKGGGFILDLWDSSVRIIEEQQQQLRRRSASCCEKTSEAVSFDVLTILWSNPMKISNEEPKILFYSLRHT